MKRIERIAAQLRNTLGPAGLEELTDEQLVNRCKGSGTLARAEFSIALRDAGHAIGNAGPSPDDFNRAATIIAKAGYNVKDLLSCRRPTRLARKIRRSAPDVRGFLNHHTETDVALIVATLDDETVEPLRTMLPSELKAVGDVLDNVNRAFKGKGVKI